MNKLIALCFALTLSACTNSDHARQILLNQGYTDIQMNGYALFDCAKDDTYHDKFTAVSPSGKVVSGVVCSGLLFKGSTIRFD